MFNRGKGKLQQIATLIGAGARIEGDVHFSGGLHVDGRVRGNVQSAAQLGDTLSISDSGVIEGSVVAPHVVLNGAVYGDIWAGISVELGATARVSGNVYYGLIQMAIGAEINGKLVHRPADSGTASESPRAAMRGS